MSLSLALLLTTVLPSATSPSEDLAFRTGTLAGWEGEGFYIAPQNPGGPNLRQGVCSSDLGDKGSAGMLHRTLVVPPGAGVIHFWARTVLGKEMESSGNLDIVLLAAGKRIVPKKMRTVEGWKAVRHIRQGRQRLNAEYVWDVSAYVGHTLRIVLIDEDKRPGCYLVCSGFRIQTATEFESKVFEDFMVQLAKQQKLMPMARFQTKHFIAVSNADDEFVCLRLNNCELIYELFYYHFLKLGFRLHEPNGKLMVAVFDNQAGFEAYIGQRLPNNLVGIYHPPSNRLVVYDIGQNRAFAAIKRYLHMRAHSIGSELHRWRYIDTVNRRAQEFRTEINIGTVMHEVAHQLSFNSGMLNRSGDVPRWLAEGLACYCEATKNHAWQGIGEPNIERMIGLVAPVRGRAPWIPIRTMIEQDMFLLQDKPGESTVLQGYAQSWCLVRMLMEERPNQMRRYMELIYPRRTTEHRLTDFVESFGSDLDRLELRYREYAKELIDRYGRGV